MRKRSFAAKRHGATFHLVHGHASRVRGGNQRRRCWCRRASDRPDTTLLECAQHPDVGEALEAAATEDERDAIGKDCRHR